jgi:TPP-dependent indolepyruvate ferredoxin oxidoreductase alpha subunit
MNTNTTADIVNVAVENLACVSVDDLKAMDHDIVMKMEEDMKECLRTVAAQKRAEKSQMDETQKHIDKQNEILSHKENVKANIADFDNLDNKDKVAIVNLGKLYHHARRANNYTGMAQIKTLILNNLCDLNLGNQYVVAHVIHLAK